MKNYTNAIACFVSVLFITCFITASDAQINLQPVSASLTFTGDPGPTTISVKIINSGPIISEPTLIAFFFSLDSIADPNVDSLIWTMKVDVIGPGDTLDIDTTIDFCGSAQLDFPDYVLGDTSFRVTFIIDPANTVAESNEVDNTGYINPPLSLGCTLGTDDPQSSSPIQIYPNPNNGVFQIKLPPSLGHNAQMSILNVTSGITVRFANDNISGENTVDVSSLPSGTYLLRIFDGDTYYGQKIVLEK